MWIETIKLRVVVDDACQFIRQQWRMWIETGDPALQPVSRAKIHSPAMANVD